MCVCRVCVCVCGCVCGCVCVGVGVGVVRSRFLDPAPRRCGHCRQLGHNKRRCPQTAISRLERSGRPSRWAVHLVKNAVSVHNVYVYVFLTAKVCMCVRHVWLASFLVL
mgnify:CR=1 FL=1